MRDVHELQYNPSDHYGELWVFIWLFLTGLFLGIFHADPVFYLCVSAELITTYS
jgi:hypothetical protein